MSYGTNGRVTPRHRSLCRSGGHRRDAVVIETTALGKPAIRLTIPRAEIRRGRTTETLDFPLPGKYGRVRAPVTLRCFRCGEAMR